MLINWEIAIGSAFTPREIVSERVPFLLGGELFNVIVPEMAFWRFLMS